MLSFIKGESLKWHIIQKKNKTTNKNSQKKTGQEPSMTCRVWGTGQSTFVSYWKCVWWVLLIEETKGQRPVKKNDKQTCKPFVINRMLSSLMEITRSAFLVWLHHWVGRGLWRVGEVWGDDSLSEEVEDVRADCRWTVLWKSLLLISTTREKRRSWKWLTEWKR